jgi:hypothetical protein
VTGWLRGRIHCDARSQRDRMPRRGSSAGGSLRTTCGPMRTVRDVVDGCRCCSHPSMRQSRCIDGTSNTERAAIQHMRIDHRRADVRMSEQLLHRSNVVPVFQQVCRERMRGTCGSRPAWSHPRGGPPRPPPAARRSREDGIASAAPTAGRGRFSPRERRTASPIPSARLDTCDRGRTAGRRVPARPRDRIDV